MLRLTRFREREDGAVAIIVAMLFFFGVMLALGALTVDVGNINADRRQLQNGADAVALAVAQQCAHGTCTPIDPTLFTIDSNLQKLVDANAADGATAIRRVDKGTPVGTPAGTAAICGNLTGLFACQPSWTPSMSNLQECPAAVPSGVKYVRAYTETKSSAGDNILPYYFGAAITGIKGANQQACAAVAVGPAGLSPSLPFAFSACEWKNATSGGTVFHPAPPYSVTNPMDPLWEKVIQFNTINGTDCNWNGHDFAGGFGWLCHDSGCTPPAASTCSITTSDGWVDANTGNGAGNDCRAEIEAAVGTVIFIPVFDCINPNKNNCPDPVGVEKSTGTHTYYHIQGYAAFFLTAVEDGSITKSLSGYPTAASTTACSAKGGKCLFGWFLQDLSKVPGIIDPNAYNFGLLVIQTVG